MEMPYRASLSCRSVTLIKPFCASVLPEHRAWRRRCVAASVTRQIVKARSDSHSLRGDGASHSGTTTGSSTTMYGGLLRLQVSKPRSVSLCVPCLCASEPVREEGFIDPHDLYFESLLRSWRSPRHVGSLSHVRRGGGRDRGGDAERITPRTWPSAVRRPLLLSLESRFDHLTLWLGAL